MSEYERVAAELNANRTVGIRVIEGGEALDALVDSLPAPQLEDDPRQQVEKWVQAARRQGQVMVTLPIDILEGVLHGRE